MPLAQRWLEYFCLYAGIADKFGILTKGFPLTMRNLLAVVGIILSGVIFGVAGCLAGIAMDRFRWLGLGPEEFWRTDPENVWAWGFIIGAVFGVVVAMIFAVWWFSRNPR